MKELLALARTIARRDPRVRITAELARATLPDVFLEELTHQFYAGDTLLHVAAAAYAIDVARALVAAGANVRAKNRRGAEPLHYAADGPPADRREQAEMVAYLVSAGAAPNALDRSGVAALHRAVRMRCTAAVRALLAAGADPSLPNKSGSTPLDLATTTTGKSGSGTAEARAERPKIEALLQRAVRYSSPGSSNAAS